MDRRNLKSIDLSRSSSIHIGPIADVYMIDSHEYPEDTYLVGSLNNIIVGPDHPPLMRLSKVFDFIRLEEERLHIGAATPGGKIVSFCKRHDIAHFEYMAHLPGTLGGMLQMNAGLKTFETFDYLLDIRTKDGLAEKADIDYGYRRTDIDDVVFEASFRVEKGFDPSKIEMFKQMRSNQPRDPSAGSCFKNPPGDYAGRLIEAVGLKGHRIGDMQFSDVHANFLVNLGGGSFEDAMAIIKLVEDRVLAQTGISLEREILVLDKRYLP